MSSHKAVGSMELLQTHADAVCVCVCVGGGGGGGPPKKKLNFSPHDGNNKKK